MEKLPIKATIKPSTAKPAVSFLPIVMALVFMASPENE
jgi:hypothetical protein